MSARLCSRSQRHEKLGPRGHTDGTVPRTSRCRPDESKAKESYVACFTLYVASRVAIGTLIRFDGAGTAAARARAVLRGGKSGVDSGNDSGNDNGHDDRGTTQATTEAQQRHNRGKGVLSEAQ